MHEFVWHELITPNKDQATEFYTELFGWDAHQLVTEPQDYVIFTQAGKHVASVVEDHQRLPHWLCYLRVEDLDLTLTHARARGARIETPATEVPGIGRLAVLLDPVGTRIAFWQKV